MASIERAASLVTLVPEMDEEEERQLLKTFADSQLVGLEDVEGYEKIGMPGELSHQPAPRQEAYKFDPDAGIKTFEQLPKVTEAMARDILMQAAAEQCCRGRDYIKDVPINKIENTLAWHYDLESFLESRYTCWTYEPYTGQEVDSKDCGRAPGPWDVELEPSVMFEDEDREAIVPHTSAVKLCHHCQQHGRIGCNRCKGRRQVKCGECSGQGHKTAVYGAVARRVACSACDGQGRKKCPGCRGSGEIECPTCRGHQRLLFSIKVKCEWRRRHVDFIEEKTDMPDELVRDVSGKVLFAEEDESVSPILNFPYAPVNEASARLVSEQDKAVKGQRLIRQRHRLRGVPVTECHFLHSGGSGMFFVYGFENRLFIEQFPRAGSCCCSLL